MSRGPRLFVAVGPWEAAGRACRTALPGWQRLAPRARWSRPESLHVTVAFLGDVEETLVPAHVEALGVVAARTRRFELSLAGGGTFGPATHPVVLWLGLAGAVEALLALEREVREALTPLHYAPDRKQYSPHLTVGRARGPKGDPALAACAGTLAGFLVPALPVDELVLFRSETRPGGAHHEPLARLTLAGP